MGLLNRLLGPAPDDRAGVRPLWRAVVAAAREPRWYRELGVADSVAGRFDMVSLVLALVLLRLEREPGQGEAAARLTELFVEDMDAQLRQSGVGDIVVGKHIGRLMAVLGGRIGALRDGLVEAGDAALVEVLERNATLACGAPLAPLAATLRERHRAIGALPLEAVLAGELAQ